MKHGPITPDDLEISVDHSEEGTLVRLHGRLGIDSSPDLRDRLLAILHGQAPKAVVVDVTQVSYIDTSGVATLLEALKIAHNRKTTLCLKGLQGRMARLFEVTGLMALFETADCRRASLATKVT